MKLIYFFLYVKIIWAIINGGESSCKIDNECLCDNAPTCPPSSPQSTTKTTGATPTWATSAPSKNHH